MMKYSRLFVFALFAFLASPTYADLFGLANGRTANLDNMNDTSVEGGANISGDITLIGGRFNYKLSPDLMLFGDLGQASFFEADGFVYGIGAFYQLRNVTLLENTDFAIKGAFHGGDLTIDGCENVSSLFGVVFDEICDISAQEITIEALISGDQLGDTDFAWYANAGMHILDETNEIGLGGGVVGDLSFGEWFAGVDFIDEFSIVGGIRYNLN